MLSELILFMNKLSNFEHFLHLHVFQNPLQVTEIFQNLLMPFIPVMPDKSGFTVYE